MMMSISFTHCLYCFPCPVALVLEAFGGGSGHTLLDGVQCTGSELRLSECPQSGVTVNCLHTKDAAVKCLSGERY